MYRGIKRRNKRFSRYNRVLEAKNYRIILWFSAHDTQDIVQVIETWLIEAVIVTGMYSCTQKRQPSMLDLHHRPMHAYRIHEPRDICGFKVMMVTVLRTIASSIYWRFGTGSTYVTDQNIGLKEVKLKKNLKNLLYNSKISAICDIESISFLQSCIIVTF